jgi:aromatic ring hydroxylase
MAVRTGLDYRERLRDGRSIYVNGERVKDVTTYPAYYSAAVNTYKATVDRLLNRWIVQS